MLLNLERNIPSRLSLLFVLSLLAACSATSNSTTSNSAPLNTVATKTTVPEFAANTRFQVVTQSLTENDQAAIEAQGIKVHAFSTKYQQLVVSFAQSSQMQWLLMQPYVLNISLAQSDRAR